MSDAEVEFLIQRIRNYSKQLENAHNEASRKIVLVNLKIASTRLLKHLEEGEWN